MREKSYVEDIDRSIYDFKDDEKDAYKVKAGLTPEIVQKISERPCLDAAVPSAFFTDLQPDADSGLGSVDRGSEHG